nr:putative membrane protein [Leptospira interrogans serovar Copenhageni/Icterohaemorrhagiae]
MTRSLVLDTQKNFADGKGLVFNEGEFVEGYTNFFLDDSANSISSFQSN